MNTTQNNHSQLLQKLDKFIRKYYLNKLIKGSLISIGLILGLFLAIDLLEYYFYFNTLTRKILFYGFIGTALWFCYNLIAIPTFKYYQIGQHLSYAQAAKVIGEHFSEIKDKLLNILQLKNDQAIGQSNDLLIAGIEQKTQEIGHINFSSAIDLGDNKKYLKYAIPPLLTILLILFISPDIIKDGTNRIIQNNTAFEKAAPFQFKLLNSSLDVVQFDDLDILIKLEGTAIPNNASLIIDGKKVKMSKSDLSSFSHKLKNVQSDLSFQVEALGHYSKRYQINMLKKPLISSFEVQLNYPSYINKKNDVLKNTGDLYIPVGTKVSWNFEGKSVRSISLKFDDNKRLIANNKQEERFEINRKILSNQLYTIYTEGTEVPVGDSIQYTINTIPDLYPSIKVDPKVDSTDLTYLYFLGDISDDYGLKNLFFKYKIDKQDQTETSFISEKIDIQKGSTYQIFTHYKNFKDLNIQPGDEVSYYFEVWDNDAINGSKYTRSGLLTLSLPDKNEMQRLADQKDDELKDDLSETIDEAKKMREEIKQIQENLLQKKNLDWQDKNQIKSVIEKQKDLQNMVESIQENFKENLSQQQKFKQFDEKVLQKYDKLQKLLEETMSDEVKELMDKLSDLLEKLNNENAIEKLEEFETNNEEMEQNLDQMLALFEKLEFEQDLQETIDDLKELSQKQEELSKETEDKQESPEQLQEKQEEITQQFDDLEKKLDDLNKKQESLEEKTGNKTDQSIDDTKPKVEDIKKSMQESKESLQDNKSKKASEQQKQSSEKMGDLAQQLEGMQQQMQSQETALNLEAVRQILENLIQLSFDQEDLIARLNTTSQKSPEYVTLIQDQYKLKDESNMVKDSLLSLAKKVFQIESFVTKEVNKLSKEVEESIDYLEARNTRNASIRQQYAMTSLNNLALMMSEVMQSMQEQMASNMQGSQNCQNPGGSKSGKSGKMSKMGDLQKQLNQQIGDLQKMMKEGKPGGKSGMSREFAKMAQQQAQIRQALEELNSKSGKEGKDAYGDLGKLIDEMEKTEEDLVNKRLSKEIMRRQEDIMTRLLEAEDAERERELDQERKSNTAQEIEKKTPPEIEEYLKKRQAEIDLYKTLPPNLKPFYKNLVEDYFKEITF